MDSGDILKQNMSAFVRVSDISEKYEIGKCTDVEETAPQHPGQADDKFRGSGQVTVCGDQIISFITDGNVAYKPGDTVFIENSKPESPFFICSIQDFQVTKSDAIVVTVKWYFRPSDIPESVYQVLLQDRIRENSSAAQAVIGDPAICERELFSSDATDTYPVTALRGKCAVKHCQDLSSVKGFTPTQDSFFYVLGYNPETKRLATTGGEIRVGFSHQARLPVYTPDAHPSQMPERTEDHEEPRWWPASVIDGDLMMFLRAARSVAAFAGMCDGGSTDDGCQVASMDETTINAMDTLHYYNYDTGKALQALVKCPVPLSMEKKWTDEDVKRFVKGLRQYGKNFHKLRKELLPHKDTGELVEYYYFWKKTAAAAAARPHRRHRNKSFKPKNTRSQRPPSSEYLDLTSASELSDESDADDSDAKEISGYFCRRCFTRTSKDWHHAGKDKTLLCTDCRMFFKKYGEDRPLDVDQEPAPFLFKPVKEDDTLNGDLTMKTRRSKESSTDKSDNKKDRNSTSSPDSPVNSTTSSHKNGSGRKSPSTFSTCSNSSVDNKDKKLLEDPLKGRKRVLDSAELTDKFSKKKRPQDLSDSEFYSDSCSISGNDEVGNEGDIENNQDDLSSTPSSSGPPSPVININTELKPNTPQLPDVKQASHRSIDLAGVIRGNKLDIDNKEPKIVHPVPQLLHPPNLHEMSKSLPPTSKLDSLSKKKKVPTATLR